MHAGRALAGCVMSYFYVNQKVRFLKVEGPVRDARKFAYEGQEASIKQLGPFEDEPRRFCTIRFNDGQVWGVAKHQIEPIIPPHQTGSWRVLDKLLPNLRGMHA